MTFAAIGDISDETLNGFFIDGRFVQARGLKHTILIDPASQMPLVTMPMATADEVRTAINAARSAFDWGPWPQFSGTERAEFMHRLADRLTARLPLLAQLWTAQVAMPMTPAAAIVKAGVARLRYYADLAAGYDFDTQRDTASGTIRVRREPIGVAALVVPWNAAFPIMMQKLGAALASGSCVVIKPAIESPLEASVLASCVKEVDFPAGVVNVVTADREESALLVGSDQIDKVSFTGSVATGRSVATAAAGNLNRMTLELGGKSAAILLDDVDLDLAVPALAPFLMPFSGQFCFSQSRILAPKSRLEEVVSRVAAFVKAFRLGQPSDPSTTHGPLLNERQGKKVMAYIEGACREGARVVTGGVQSSDFDRGFYVEPTVFDRVTPEMTIAREEVFGPVVTIQSYGNDADAIELSNSVSFGLSGSVFGRDVERAYRIASRLRTGQVGINRIALEPAAPFGGFKKSGFGREGGIEGLESFTEIKAIFQ
uniref:aldehyde dehydrogenase family protein n=1 Tax=uncultured Sphingomonas sp. TaxID=158754 RepID=UPI0035C99035